MGVIISLLLINISDVSARRLCSVVCARLPKYFFMVKCSSLPRLQRDFRFFLPRRHAGLANFLKWHIAIPVRGLPGASVFAAAGNLTPQRPTYVCSVLADDILSSSKKASPSSPNDCNAQLPPLWSLPLDNFLLRRVRTPREKCAQVQAMSSPWANGNC